MLNCGLERPILLPNRRRNSSIRFATVKRSAISLRSARSEPAGSKTARVAVNPRTGAALSLEVFGIIKEVRDQFISLTYTTKLYRPTCPWSQDKNAKNDVGAIEAM